MAEQIKGSGAEFFLPDSGANYEYYSNKLWH